MNEPQVFGGIVCADPLIFLGKRMPALDNYLGLMTFQPELFRGRKSLSLLTLGYTYEPPYMIRKLSEELKEAREDFPQASVVMLANTPREHELFQEAGIQSLLANELMFGRIERYHLPDQRPEKRYDAIYVGRLDPLKRHELAKKVQSLLCLYFRTDQRTVETYREILPQAVFGNHDFNNNEFRLLLGDDYLCAVDSAHVGLCLSEAEGAMRASIEYQLCGLPVVSTPSIGGRDRYLTHEFGRIVEPDADEVAQAVVELKEAGFDPLKVRQNAVGMLERDRQNFLNEVQEAIDRTFGPTAPAFPSFEPFEAARAQETRPVSHVLEPTFPGNAADL